MQTHFPRRLCWHSIALLASLTFSERTFAANLPPAASFYVPSLPDIHQDPERPLHIFAGHLPSDPRGDSAKPEDVTAHLFFVLIKNRRIADKERIIIWFNGGPGCSSFDGLMMEVGPWRMDGKGGFKVVEGGWEEYTTMLYIDQPAGTGFSYTSTDRFVHNIDQASEQLIIFLSNFYQVFPEYQSMETYLGGESYAGQFIPYFADALLKDESLNLNIRGAAIGNGWIDARRQYPSYIDYAVKMNILEEGSEDWNEAKERTDECMEEIEGVTWPEPISTPSCEGLLLDVTRVREKKIGDDNYCINIYDVRLDDLSPACGMNWPPDIKPVTDYLDRDDVVKALHAEAHTGAWTECKGAVHSNFHETTFNSSIVVLPSVVERIPVLIFAGDQDLICNHLGLEAMIKEMEWDGQKGLGTVQTQSWTVDGSPAGTWVSSRNLTYTKIFNASHMAPFDAPHVAHDMILRFMGVNFSAIADGSARIASSVGDDVKPGYFGGSQEAEEAPAKGDASSGQTEQSKAKWEAYYNAGSSGLALVIIVAIIALILWCRMRRRGRGLGFGWGGAGGGLRLPMNNRDRERGGVVEDEESVPLTRGENGSAVTSRKGKERAVGGDEDGEEEGRPIFDVGDSDEEDEHGHGKEYRDVE